MDNFNPLPGPQEEFWRLPAQVLYAGVDVGRGADRTAVRIAEQAKDASIRFLGFAESVAAATDEIVARMINRVTRDLCRPKGYSQSHWRKIYRQSPRMRPVEIVYDKAASDFAAYGSCSWRQIGGDGRMAFVPIQDMYSAPSTKHQESGKHE